MSNKIITSSNAPAPIGPYSQAVWAGNTLYLSGQIAIDPSSGTLKNSNISEETEQIMKNILAVLEEADLGFSNIAKASIFLKNMDDFNEVNKVYGSYFKNNYPARETVEVSKLPKNVNVEISVIATK
jgi:2-iminobutanoate/2-iminopropanoate deaminase